MSHTFHLFAPQTGVTAHANYPSLIHQDAIVRLH